MRQLILLSVLMFAAGCAQDRIHSRQQPPVPNSNAPTSTKPTPFSLENMSVADSERLERMLPAKVRSILEQSEQLELLDLNPDLPCIDPKTNPRQRNSILGCRVAKKAVINDANLKKQLIDSFISGVATPGRGMACFTPRHGLRAIHKNERVELLICFECEGFQGESTAGNVGGTFDTAVQELFLQILNDAKKN